MRSIDDTLYKVKMQLEHELKIARGEIDPAKVEVDAKGKKRIPGVIDK